VKLPENFRKLGPIQRRSLILDGLELSDHYRFTDDQYTLSDALIENSVGWSMLPLGVVTDFPVNGKLYNLPLVTEEPSVIAAASHAARILGKHGGLKAESSEGIMRSQIFLEGASLDNWVMAKLALEAAAKEQLTSMSERGGGLVDISSECLKETGLILLTFKVDVCDAQGANLLNTLMESLSPLAESLLGGNKLLAILSNHSPERLSRASFRIPLPGESIAHRIVLASRAAQESVDRAVTHNKGIMNGITALVLATGNDTRAAEAGAHAWACRSGRYMPLSCYKIEGGDLVGEIELPLALATVGGATKALPDASFARRISGIETSRELGAVAAALGLAQNYAALLALCTEGIQKGHMALHKRRVNP